MTFQVLSFGSVSKRRHDLRGSDGRWTPARKRGGSSPAEPVDAPLNPQPRGAYFASHLGPLPTTGAEALARAAAIAEQKLGVHAPLVADLRANMAGVTPMVDARAAIEAVDPQERDEGFISASLVAAVTAPLNRGLALQPTS